MAYTHRQTSAALRAKTKHSKTPCSIKKVLGFFLCSMVGCAVKPRSPAVATCRQTVEALLAPLPPLGSGCLRFDSRRFRFPGRSHLSPDGGGFTRAAVHRLAADVYDSTAGDSGSSAVATCRQTVEALLAPLSTAWQRMSTIRQPAIRFLGRSHLSPDGGSFTCAASTAWQRMAKVKEQKEKGLLLHPPLGHEPT